MKGGGAYPTSESAISRFPRRYRSSGTPQAPGIEIRFDEGLWRVIAVEDGDSDRIDQRAVCVRQS